MKQPFNSHILGRLLMPVAFVLMVVSCGIDTKPQSVAVGKDDCAGCGMTIEDPKFACEFISDKGKCYKFDDVSCLFHYLHKQQLSDSAVAKIYVANYAQPDSLIDVTKASLVLGAGIHSPMNGGVAAFSNPGEARNFAVNTKSILLDSWQRLKVQH